MTGRLIDADAFEEEARNRIDMQDLYLPVHIRDFVIKEMPTVEAIPIEYIEKTMNEWRNDGYEESAESLSILMNNWKVENATRKEE